MADKVITGREVYFEEPLVQMSFLKRIIVRAIGNVFMTIFMVMTMALIISPIYSFRWLGALFLIIFLERLYNSRQPLRRISDMPRKGKINLAHYLSPHSRRAMILAHEASHVSKTNFLFSFLSVLLEDREVSDSLKRLDVNIEEFVDKLSSYIKTSEPLKSEDEMNRFLSEAMRYGLLEAELGDADFIGCGELFTGVSRLDNKDVKRLFDIFDINSDDLGRALVFGRVRRLSFFKSIPKTIGGFAGRHMRNRVVNRAWTSRPTPILNRFSTDYSEYFRAGGASIMIGHADEYERLLNILTSGARPNALLIGEPGVGKGVVVAHLAYMMSVDRVPPELFDKRLVSLDITNLISGADQGEIQTRIQEVFNEIYAAGNIILHIPDIHNLARTAGPKQISAASVIVPLITSNEFPLIGTTAPKEYKTYIESDSAFANAFVPIRFNEISVDEAIIVLSYKAILLEREFSGRAGKVKVSYGAVKKAVEIAAKYFHSTPLPGSAADLLKEAFSYGSRHKIKLISSDDIITVAESRINIPIRRAGKEESSRLLNLEETIHERLVGQEAAVKAVSEALREYRSGLSRVGGPIGAFLFVGPTGVGKTELSKILAKIQFGSEDAMIRFDMSEYQDKQSVFQFIGSPDGSVSGLLTDRVLEKPYSLILLDEFEKAHPDILNIFLQVFDDGRLTDNFGHTVNFENTIIIATSNANSDFVKEEIEKGTKIEDIAAGLKKKLTGFFRPELINRFSSVVVFRDLREEDIKIIAERNLKSIADSLYDSQGIELEFEEGAVIKIAELGFDKVFGARPLRNTISENIKGPLSKMILGNNLKRGAKINVALENDKITLNLDDQ